VRKCDFMCVSKYDNLYEEVCMKKHMYGNCVMTTKMCFSFSFPFKTDDISAYILDDTEDEETFVISDSLRGRCLTAITTSVECGGAVMVKAMGEAIGRVLSHSVEQKQWKLAEVYIPHYIYITFTLHLHYIYITFTLHLHYIYINKIIIQFSDYFSPQKIC
jgi:hypothetical protein